MTRYRAAGMHLFISVLISLVVLFVVFCVWYPGGFAKLMGVGQIYLLLMGVDVCLGPLLTLAVYRHGKKGMNFDLTVIATLQILALLYGLNIVFQARPAFIVLQKNVFKVARATDLTEKGLLQATRPEWRHLPLTGPILVAAIAPEDPKVKEEVILGGGDWYNFPKLYMDYTSKRESVLKDAKSLSKLRGLSHKSDLIINEFIKKQARPESDFVYLPIVLGFEASMTAVLDAKNADFKDIIDIDSPN